ncbi:MAG: hypothetical protein ACR5K5_03555 [Wolbachia sp.]
MTHQSSLSTRTNSCIPTRVTDSCCHRNFDPRCHNQFDPRHNGLELNIQLPDFDVNIPPCPACPPCPPCPSYPQPKPDIDTKPKTKDPIDISKLTIRVPVGGDEILDAKTEKPTGLSAKECKRIVENPKNNLEIVGGRIVGKCDNTECDKCVEAVNNSIVDKVFFSSAYDASVPESTVYIL